MIARGVAAAVAAAVLLGSAAAGATPTSASAPGGAASQRALLDRYVAALRAQRYDAAYALLEPGARAYFRTAANYASGFTSSGLRIVAAHVTDARGSDAFRLFFVRETLHLNDPAHGKPSGATATVPIGVVQTGTAARIKDLGHPWRAYATLAGGAHDGLHVSVRNVAYYDRAIDLVVTFANLGDGFVTLLPYGRTVLRDGSGHVYHPIVAKPFTHTDRQLFLGVHLAANAEYTGVLSFATPRLDDRVPHLTLTVGPNLRDGGDAPFAIDVTDIGPRA